MEQHHGDRGDGDVIGEITKLKQESDGTIQTPGSRTLVQAMLEADLVDELRLMVFPVVLGTGNKLFGDYSDKKDMELTESRTVGEGVVVQIYQRAR